jgi:hypothetical protein
MESENLQGQVVDGDIHFVGWETAFRQHDPPPESPSPSYYSGDIILAVASRHSMAFCGLHFRPLEHWSLWEGSAAPTVMLPAL